MSDESTQTPEEAKAQVLEEIQAEAERPKTDEETIEELKTRNRDLILLSKKQKETIHRASMKINHLERELYMSQNQIDSMGGMFIAIIKRFGENDTLAISREEVELVPPGTMINDEQTEDMIILKALDVSKQPKIMRGPGGVPMMMGPNGPVPMQQQPPPGPRAVPSPPEDPSDGEPAEETGEPSDGE